MSEQAASPTAVAPDDAPTSPDGAANRSWVSASRSASSRSRRWAACSWSRRSRTGGQRRRCTTPPARSTRWLYTALFVELRHDLRALQRHVLRGEAPVGRARPDRTRDPPDRRGVLGPPRAVIRRRSRRAVHPGPPLPRSERGRGGRGDARAQLPVLEWSVLGLRRRRHRDVPARRPLLRLAAGARRLRTASLTASGVCFAAAVTTNISSRSSC